MILSKFRFIPTLSLLSLVVAAPVVACDGDDDVEPTPDTNDASMTPITDAAADVGVPSRDAEVEAAKDAAGDATDATPLPSTEVRLEFAAKVGSQPFACGSEYQGVGAPSQTITPVDLRFYVHDVRVVDADGNEIPVKLDINDWQLANVALLDFEDGTGECTNGDVETNSVVFGKVDTPVVVKGIKFKLGVPLELNHGDLAGQPTPLDRTSMFWAWNAGYIFLRGESGSELPVEDAGTTVMKVHATHVGSGGCSGNAVAGEPVVCTRPNRPEFAFAEFDLTTNKIVFDFAAFKSGSDLSGSSCHGHGASCVAPFVALGIDSMTGNYIGNQTVFHKE